MNEGVSPSTEQLTVLNQVVRDVARHRRLSAEDAQEFGQAVHVRLLERHYDIFGRFSGRSSLKTYLSVVVHRLLLDWRRHEYGKWRPSSAAKKLGPQAIRLDRLMHLEGYTADEAICMVQLSGKTGSTSQLAGLAERLPPHPPRRLIRYTVHQESCVPFDDPIDHAERLSAERRIRCALMRALRQLPLEDQQLLDVRYRRQHTVSDIARAARQNPKVLYRRYERLLRSLRASIEKDLVEA
jgi:RNA polymerase sigma factor (sigma-70 family)